MSERVASHDSTIASLEAELAEDYFVPPAKRAVEPPPTCVAEPPATRVPSRFDALFRGWYVDLPYVHQDPKTGIERTVRGQGPFVGAPAKLTEAELKEYYEARAHQPWRRPPRSHAPYGIKWWDKMNMTLFFVTIVVHARGVVLAPPSLLGALVRLPLALGYVDLLTGLTHALFDGLPWLVPYSLRIGAGRLAPIHEHRDTSTICSFTNVELCCDMMPTVLGELLASHAIMWAVGGTADMLFLLLSALIGVTTQMIHKHAHLRGHAKAHPRVGRTARVIFALQDMHIVMSHEMHKIHHTNGTNPCLLSGWFNAVLNPIVAFDEHYDVVPKRRLDQPVYDIPEVEAERKRRLDEWYGKDAVGREH